MEEGAAAAGERVYRSSGPGRGRVAAWLVGGILAFALAAVGFVVAMFVGRDPVSLQLSTTVPALLGIRALMTARALARAPREVGVSAAGVRIEGGSGRRVFPWEAIGHSALTPVFMSPRRRLSLYDPSGKVMAEIGDAIEDLAGLAQVVAARLEAKGDGLTQAMRLRKARRAALFCGLVGLVVFAGGPFIALEARATARKADELARSGVPGRAAIERRFLAPNGVTPRLVYRITTTGGRSGGRNVQVRREVWEMLATAKEVPVVYVPSDPENSRLTFGEVSERQPPAKDYAIAVLACLLGALMLAGAVLLSRGYDIKVTDGRLSIRRFGT